MGARPQRGRVLAVDFRASPAAGLHDQADTAAAGTAPWSSRPPRGSIRLFDQKGEPQADIAYTSYQLDGADRREPPGHLPVQRRAGRIIGLAAARQRRTVAAFARAARAVSSASPDLVPNAETWLDFTDLVFIDPVGTGYSRFVATGDDVAQALLPVDGDVNAIALVIRRWLEKHERLLSPKYVVGESYGGIRGPKIVHNLQTEQGVGVRG